MNSSSLLDLQQQVRKGLATAPADSDAAVILREALDESAALAFEQQGARLESAIKQADEARRFRITEESPLPQGWPKPSLPGLIRIKNYPPSRFAWVRAPENRNGQFMILFRHIKNQDIAMTAPVVMEYARAATDEPAKLGSTEAMAFLYRRLDQGQAGQYGAVAVADDKPVQVVSVGLKGSYREANFRNAIADLRDWLSKHPQWQASGPPRVLAYNSPFLPFWMKYSEVQIPVTPTGKASQLSG